MAAATEHKHRARHPRPPRRTRPSPTPRAHLRPNGAILSFKPRADLSSSDDDGREQGAGRRPLNVRPDGAILSFKPQADLASDDDGDFPNLQQGTSKPPAAVGSHELEGAHDPNFRASGCSWIPQVRGRPLPPGAWHPSFAVHSSGTTRRPPTATGTMAAVLFIWCFDSFTAVACAPRAPPGPPRSASSRCSARSSLPPPT